MFDTDTYTRLLYLINPLTFHSRSYKIRYGLPVGRKCEWIATFGRRKCRREDKFAHDWQTPFH